MSNIGSLGVNRLHNKYQGGFTIVELMIVLTIGAILMAIAAPNLQSTIRSNRIIAQSNELVASFNLARSEAIKRGGNVAICPTVDGGDSCVNSTNWKTGWVVFSDTDGAGVIDVGDTVIRIWDAIPGDITLTRNAGGSNFVRYTRTAGSDSGLVSFCLDCPDCGDSHERVIDVAPTTGRVSTARNCP